MDAAAAHGIAQGQHNIILLQGFQDIIKIINKRVTAFISKHVNTGKRATFRYHAHNAGMTF